MNATPKTYHVAVGFPATVRLWTRTVFLKYGAHAREQARRYAQEIPLPYVLPRAASAVEIEVSDGRVVKTLYRLPFTANSDLCMVVVASGFVKTLWLNQKGDAHATLDTSKYSLPTEG